MSDSIDTTFIDSYRFITRVNITSEIAFFHLIDQETMKNADMDI